jgi:hypothetical protein
VLVEAKNILTKVYSVDSATATQEIVRFAAGPVAVLPLDSTGIISALQLADTHGLDLTDAVLLHLARQHSAGYVATEEQNLAQVCGQLGITPESPLDANLRQQVAAWEAGHLAPKGMARVLHRVHQWLSQSHPQAAQDFWSHTGGGSHLP